MKLPIYNPPPKQSETPEGLALEKRALNRIAPLYATALLLGEIAPEGYALGMLLFAHRDPARLRVVVLATEEGDVLSWRWFDAGWGPESPDHLETAMRGGLWFCAWQRMIGGPPCAAWEGENNG